MLHLGGTKVLRPAAHHGQGTQGVDLLEMIPAPGVAVPVHHDDYPVFRSPLSEFMTAVRRAGLATEVTTVERGQTISLGGVV